MTRPPRPPQFAPLIFGVALLAAGCGGPDPTTPPAAAGATDADRVHDAGVVLVPDGGRVAVRHAFPLSNPSAAPAAVRITGRSCGCTDVLVDPPVLPPGGTGTATLRYELTAGSGETRHTAVVEVGPAGAAEPVELALSATGAASVQFDPPVMKAELTPGAAREIGVTVVTYEPADGPEREVELLTDSPLLAVRDRYELSRGTLSQRNGSPLRARRTHFVCRVLGDGADGRRWTAAEERVPLIARCGGEEITAALRLIARPLIAARPARVLFFNAAPGTEKTVTLTADVPFALGPVEGAGGLLKIEAVTGAPSRRHTVTLRLTARPATAGGGPAADRAEMSFPTDHPRQDRVRVSVSVMNVAPANETR